MSSTPTDRLTSYADRCFDWIKAADTKAAFIATLTLAAVGALATFAGQNPANATREWWKLAALCSPALLTLWFVGRTVYPQLSRSGRSLVYFGSVAAMSRDDYLRAVTTRSDDEHLRDLAMQTHRLSEITLEKYTQLRYAMVFLPIALPCVIIAIWIVLAPPAPPGTP